jgi:hypothetical protein
MKERFFISIRHLRYSKANIKHLINPSMADYPCRRCGHIGEALE